MKHKMEGTPPWVAKKVTDKEVDGALADLMKMFEVPKREDYKPIVAGANTEHAFILKVVAPETSKENFVVEVKNLKLFIEHKAKNETVINRSFSFSKSLDPNLVTNSTTASYNDGVLTVEIPKEKPKKISVG